jgi:hypothetical protein
MPQLSTLKLVADIVVSRILHNAEQYHDVAAALEEAYPFGDDPHGRQVWLDALLRHAFLSDRKTEQRSALRSCE